MCYTLHGKGYVIYNMLCVMLHKTGSILYTTCYAQHLDVIYKVLYCVCPVGLHGAAAQCLL